MIIGKLKEILNNIEKYVIIKPSISRIEPKKDITE